MATIIPLIFVVVLGMIKEFIGDHKRYKEDQKVNSLPAVKLVKENGKYIEKHIQSQDVAVGDVLRVYDNQIVPADCVILSTQKVGGDLESCEEIISERITLKGNETPN